MITWAEGSETAPSPPIGLGGEAPPVMPPTTTPVGTSGLLTLVKTAGLNVHLKFKCLRQCC